MAKLKKCLYGVVFAAVILTLLGLVFGFKQAPTYAEEQSADDYYNYSLVTSENGEQSYGISIRAAFKPLATTLVIPESHNGLPITEISNNGFMSCTNLKRIFLPLSVKKIGNNAFMNCAKLERLILPNVESIGMNAFAMCPTLDRMFIPKTVKSVGANILRNNNNCIFVQNSEEQVASEWQATWKSYFTGNIVFDAQSQDTIQYREILDEEGIDVIGYELVEGQFLADDEADIVIYNAIKTEENPEYLPLLNICSEAFTYSYAHSITFRDICTVDATAPDFTHKINIRSNALLSLLCSEVNFEVGITFEHPSDLQNTNQSYFDGSEIIGDDLGKSEKIFAESTVQSVTLPNDLDFIPQKMFYNCPYLTNVKYFGQDDGGNNILNGITRIGTGAFSSCSGLSSLSIPSSVTKMGDSVFFDWGVASVLTGITQTIKIDFYDGYLPSSWSDQWSDGIGAMTDINYKAPIPVIIDLQDNIGGTETVFVKLGYEMSVIEKPQRLGYTFNGIYSQKKGNGFQYYTDEMEVNRLWQDGDPTTIYVSWTAIPYDIIYPPELEGITNPNPKQYTADDEIELQYIEDDAFIYYFAPAIIEKGTIGDVKVTYRKEPKQFSIKYELDDFKGNVNPNPKKYDVTQEIVFIDLECEGYTFEWIPAMIPQGSTKDDLTVKGVWTPKKYNIIYENLDSDMKVISPLQYTYGEALVLKPVVRCGFHITWDKTNIPVGTIGDVTVTAVSYKAKTLDECKYDWFYEIWTFSQFEQLRDQPNTGSGRTYLLMRDLSLENGILFTPLNAFRGTLDGKGFSISCELDTSAGGNIGLFKVNYGTITRLTLNVRYSILSEDMVVNAGCFAGINYGTILQCSVSASGGLGLRCYANATSYAGFIVGVNEGSIENCDGEAWLFGHCIMGAVAGWNRKNIYNCKMGKYNTKIEYTYNGVSACVGGIVGFQESGYVICCHYQGQILWDNMNVYGNRVAQPYIGIIIGLNDGGDVNANTWACSGASKIISTTTAYRYVEWTEGSKKYTHDQWLYVKEEESGRIFG